MRLTKVHIENFKRFGRLEVELAPLNCLVGPNNSGKTTLLQALALFDFCVHHCMNRKNANLELRKRTIPPEEFYVLPVSNPMELWTDRKSMAGGRQKVIKIRVVVEEGREVTASVELDYNRFGVGIDSTDQSQEWLQSLSRHRIAYLPVFSVFLAQEERRTPAVIDDELARGHVHTVIRNLILDLKQQGRHEELIEILRRSFPTLQDMAIQFDEVSDRYISVTYKEAGRPKEFDVFSGGSGFQQFLYLFGFILLRQPTVILLDEPDVHLHGTLQKALLQELQRLVANGKQVLFATHSRDLINGVSPEDIVSLEEEGASRLAVGFDVYDMLDRLGSVDPTELPVIQAYQRVLLVEDQADLDLLSVFCSKSLGLSVWQQVARRLAVCFAKGNPYKQDIDRLRRQLQQMVSLKGRPLKLFAVADWDYYPDTSQLDQELPKNHIQWHIWERAEIENYLLCPKAIVRLLREEKDQRHLEETPFNEEYNRLVDRSRDSANDHLVEAFTEYRRRLNERWDTVTLSRRAREYLNEHWETNKVSLADAKEVVLPGIKRWLQQHHVGQFSNKALAESLARDDLPEEVHTLAKDLADFAGIRHT